MYSSIDGLNDTEAWSVDMLKKILRYSDRKSYNKLYDVLNIKDLSTIACGHGRHACVWPYRTSTEVLKLTVCSKDAHNAARLYASGKKFKHLVSICDPGVVKLEDNKGVVYYLWKTKRLKKLQVARIGTLSSILYEMTDGEWGWSGRITSKYKDWSNKQAVSMLEELGDIRACNLLFDIGVVNIMQNSKGVAMLHDFDCKPISALRPGVILLPSQV